MYWFKKNKPVFIYAVFRCISKSAILILFKFFKKEEDRRTDPRRKMKRKKIIQKMYFNESPESQGPILKALGTQETLKSTENLISGNYFNALPGVISAENVTQLKLTS